MHRFIRLICAMALLPMAGCMRNSTQTWEDLKTAGRYMHRGVDAMFGKDYESRLLTSDEEFVGPYDDEFIPRGIRILEMPMPDWTPLCRSPREFRGKKGFLPSLNSTQFPMHSESISNRFISKPTNTSQKINMKLKLLPS